MVGLAGFLAAWWELPSARRLWPGEKDWHFQPSETAIFWRSANPGFHEWTRGVQHTRRRCAGAAVGIYGYLLRSACAGTYSALRSEHGASQPIASPSHVWTSGPTLGSIGDTKSSRLLQFDLRYIDLLGPIERLVTFGHQGDLSCRFVWDVSIGTLNDGGEIPEIAFLVRSGSSARAELCVIGYLRLRPGDDGDRAGWTHSNAAVTWRNARR